MTEDSQTVLAQKLEALPILQSLPQPQVMELAGKLRLKHAKTGETVLTDGEPAVDAYLILSGTLRIEKTTADGKQILIDIIGPGEIVGEMALITGETRSADVIAHSDCDLAVMSPASFGFLRSLKPEINDKLLKILSTRLQEATARLRDIGLMPLEERLGSILLNFAAQYGVRGPEGITLNIKLTQTDLAQLAACSREHVSRIFKDWENSGLVAKTGPYITLCRPDALKK